MTSKKFKLKWIVKNNARKARIRKTLLELAAEVSELNKVRGVSAFVIMYGRGDSIPVIWPPRPVTEQWKARKDRIRKTLLELAEEVSAPNKVWGASAFVIMYGGADSIPVIWPPRPETEQWLQRLRSFPEAERIKDMTTQEENLQGRTAMNQEVLYNGGTKDMQINLLLHRYHQQGKSFENFSIDELCDLFFYLEEKNLELKKRIPYVDGLVQAEGGNKPQVPDQGSIAGHSSTKN